MGKKLKENEENVFTKEQFISSKLFKNNKDILQVLIKDDETISIQEAQERIENFMKGKVN